MQLCFIANGGGQSALLQEEQLKHWGLFRKKANERQKAGDPQRKTCTACTKRGTITFSSLLITLELSTQYFIQRWHSLPQDTVLETGLEGPERALHKLREKEECSVKDH